MAARIIPTCPSCQYELRGLPLRGTCPECGNQYALSLPGLEPGSLPPTSRYQRYGYEADLGRRAIIKGLMLSIVGVGIITAWKGAEAGANGPQAASAFLFRYGVSLVAALALYLMFVVMRIIEFTGPMPRALLGVAGALAAGMLTQHLFGEMGLWVILGLPWLLGLIVHLGVAADLLDLDMTEAGLLALFTVAARVILKFAVFDQM